MREIKVRGLSVEELVGNDQWVYGFGVNFTPMSDGSTDAYLYTSTHGVYEVYPESVGQYTGLKDKNGKEIYEGDIVQGSTDIFENMTGQVVYAGCTFVVDGVAKYSKIREELNKSYGIIGNVWEHPHLLEGRDEA